MKYFYKNSAAPDSQAPEFGEFKYIGDVIGFLQETVESQQGELYLICDSFSPPKEWIQTHIWPSTKKWLDSFSPRARQVVNWIEANGHDGSDYEYDDDHLPYYVIWDRMGEFVSKKRLKEIVLNDVRFIRPSPTEEDTFVVYDLKKDMTYTVEIEKVTFKLVEVVGGWV